MADPVANAAQKHPAPEGLVYQYGTAGVSSNSAVYLDDGANVIFIVPYKSVRSHPLASSQLKRNHKAARLTLTELSSTQ
jgi:predicted molibdopterin-dependent oxidoreductase YjgC